MPQRGRVGPRTDRIVDELLRGGVHQLQVGVCLPGHEEVIDQARHLADLTLRQGHHPRAQPGIRIAATDDFERVGERRNRVPQLMRERRNLDSWRHARLAFRRNRRGWMV